MVDRTASHVSPNALLPAPLQVPSLQEWVGVKNRSARNRLPFTSKMSTEVIARASEGRLPSTDERGRQDAH